MVKRTGVRPSHLERDPSLTESEDENETDTEDEDYEVPIKVQAMSKPKPESSQISSQSSESDTPRGVATRSKRSEKDRPPQSKESPQKSKESPQKSKESQQKSNKDPPPPKYTRNHTIKCTGEMILPNGKQAVKYNVIMTPTAAFPDRDKVTYVGYVTTREWEDGRTALSALGGSLKPWPKVLKCDEWENYSDYLKEEHEIWEMNMTDDSNKINLNLDEPSFHVEKKRIYFISGRKEIWDLDEKPFGKKLTEEEIDDLPFSVMYSGTEIQYSYDPKKMLEELSNAWRILNESQMFAGPDQEAGSLYLGLGPSMMSSVLKGYLYTPSQVRGLMPHVTAYLSGKAYGCGKSWAALIAVISALGGDMELVSNVMLNPESSAAGLWKHLDRCKIAIIDELSLDPSFLSLVADIVDNKFNNCKKQVNEKAYYPTAGVVLCGNYMKRDLINVKKGRDKIPVLPDKTQSKMEFCFVGNKEIKHPNTKKMRDDSFEAANNVNKHFPILLAIKWHSMFAVEDLDMENREKISSFTTGNRSGTFLGEFVTFWLAIKDHMVQYEVQLPPCLQSDEVDLNVHTYFFVNKDKDVEDFLKYVIETDNHGKIEICQHKKVPGVKLRPVDFEDSEEWKDFLNDSRTTFTTTFKGQSQRVTFLPTNSVKQSTIEMLKKKRFTVENAIQEEIHLVERELNKSLKKIMAEVKKAGVVIEITLNEMAPDGNVNLEGVAGTSGVQKGKTNAKEEFRCDVGGCRKYGVLYKSKTSYETHQRSRVHVQGIKKDEAALAGEKIENLNNDEMDYLE